MLNKSINLIMYVFITQLSKKSSALCVRYFYLFCFFELCIHQSSKKFYIICEIFLCYFFFLIMYIFISYQKKFCKLCVSYSYLFFFNAKGVKIHSTKFSASTQNGHIIFSPKINGGKNFIFKFRFTNLGAANCIQICSISFLKI